MQDVLDAHGLCSFAMAGMAAASLVGSYMSSSAAGDAADQQAEGQRRSEQFQRDQLQIQNNNLAPYRQAGAQAVGQLQTGTAPGGQFAHSFDANDLNANMAPGYQFALDQGNRATTNMANMSGGAFSGNTLKAVSDYNVGAAQQGYQQAFNNYQTNQSNIYGRLKDIANLGQQSSTNTATGGSVYGANIGANMAGAANAQAGGTAAQGNIAGSALNNAGSWYTLGNMMRPQTASTGGASISPASYQAMSGGDYGVNF